MDTIAIKAIEKDSGKAKCLNTYVADCRCSGYGNKETFSKMNVGVGDCKANLLVKF